MKSRNIVVAALVMAFVAVGAWLAFRSPLPPPPQPISPSSASNPSESVSQPPTATRDRTGAPGASAISAVPVISGQAPQSLPVLRAPASSVHPRRDAASPSAALAAGSPAQSRDPMVDLDKVHHMFTDYHTLMGENPVGTNAEIMQALMGANRNQATLGPPEGQTLNDKGELTDRWGTPYFFHQLSANTMEIRSAGPDKIMGTADDITLK